METQERESLFDRGSAFLISLGLIPRSVLRFVISSGSEKSGFLTFFRNDVQSTGVVIFFSKFVEVVVRNLICWCRQSIPVIVNIIKQNAEVSVAL